MSPIKSYINDNIENCISKVYNQINIFTNKKIIAIDTLRRTGKFGHYRNSKFPVDIKQCLYKNLK